MDLANAVRQQRQTVRDSLAAMGAAEAAIRATLTPEQAALFNAYEAAMSAHVLGTADLDILELRRHLPALALALPALWAHVCELEDPGVCCAPLT